MGKKIGIGIIGTGFARRTQIPAFAAIDDAKIISVSSGRQSNAESTAKDFDIPHWSGNWRETVEHEGVDLVCITTPPNLHREMVIHCLNNQKHILCEKPMAMNVSEATEMAEKSSDSGLMALIDHELRFTNGRMKAFQLIRDGQIGKVRHVKYLFRNAARGDAGLPWTWWSDIEQGGGALGAIGSHVIDSIIWFTGVGIKTVSCRLHTHIKDRPFDDHLKPVTTDDEALMVMSLHDGPSVTDATASVSTSLVEAGPYRNRIEFFGTTGALRVEDGGELFFADIKKSNWETVEFDVGDSAPGMPDGGWSRGFTILSRKIVSSL